MGKKKKKDDLKAITCEMVCEFAAAGWHEGVCYCDIKKGPVDSRRVRTCKYLGTKDQNW